MFIAHFFLCYIIFDPNVLLLYNANRKLLLILVPFHVYCALLPFRHIYICICNPYLVDEVVGSLQFQSCWSSLQCLSGATAGVKTA